MQEWKLEKLEECLERRVAKAAAPDHLIDISALTEWSFIVLALWLHGRMSAAMIAKSASVTTGVVAGVCRSQANGGLMPKSRAEMPTAERQRHLDHLRANRLDGGRLPDWAFRALEL